MREPREIYDIPDVATCLKVIAALVADPICASIFANHDIRKDYEPSEVAEFERVEAPLLQGMKLFYQNLDLLRALARRQELGDFASIDDPKLARFLSSHLLPFKTSGNYALPDQRHRKMGVDDFLTVANLLLRDEQYYRLLLEYGAKRDHADLEEEARMARQQFEKIEFTIKKNLGYLDVRPYFGNLISGARQENLNQIDQSYLTGPGDYYLQRRTAEMIEW